MRTTVILVYRARARTHKHTHVYPRSRAPQSVTISAWPTTTMMTWRRSARLLVIFERMTPYAPVILLSCFVYVHIGIYSHTYAYNGIVRSWCAGTVSRYGSGVGERFGVEVERDGRDPGYRNGVEWNKSGVKVGWWLEEEAFRTLYFIGIPRRAPVETCLHIYICTHTYTYLRPAWTAAL